MLLFCHLPLDLTRDTYNARLMGRNKTMYCMSTVYNRVFIKNSRSRSMGKGVMLLEKYFERDSSSE